MSSKDFQKPIKNEPAESDDDLSWIDAQELLSRTPAEPPKKKQAPFPWLEGMREDLIKLQNTELEVIGLKAELQEMKKLKETAEEETRKMARKLLETEKELVASTERERELLKNLGEFEVDVGRLYDFIRKVIEDNE